MNICTKTNICASNSASSQSPKTLAVIMIDYIKTDNPKEIAELFSKKYQEKGYSLNFSIESLEIEIDSILENYHPENLVEREILEAELTAYFGETLCRIFEAEWNGSYYGPLNHNGDNFYLCTIKKGEFEFGPSRFFGYYLSNGKKDTGTFKNYLHFSYYYRGNEKFIEDGLLKKIK